MNLRPRPALTLALATALAGTAPLPAVADDAEEALVERCFTEALTVEEVKDGATSVVECYQVPADEEDFGRSSTTLAIVYDISDTSGPELQITGTTCTGTAVSFGSGHAWNNIISATTLVTCGNAKHWSNADFTGSNQFKTGLGYHTITGTMNNNTSSIEYSP